MGPRALRHHPDPDVPRRARRRHAPRAVPGLDDPAAGQRELRAGRPAPGDRLDPVRRAPLDAAGGHPADRRGVRPRRRRRGGLPAARAPAVAPDPVADGSPDPAVHLPRRLHGGPRARVRGGGVRADRGGVHHQRPRRATRGHGRGGAGGCVRDPVVGPRDRALRVPHLHPVQQALPRVRELRERLVPQAHPARPAAGDGLRGRERDVRPQDPRRPLVEGPPRRLHLHRVRALPAGLPGVQHRQAAQPQGDDHGHPGRGDRRRADRALHPQLAGGALDVRPRRHPQDRGRRAAAGRRDPELRRHLGLPDLRRLRGGLPGPHRAR